VNTTPKFARLDKKGKRKQTYLVIADLLRKKIERAPKDIGNKETYDLRTELRDNLEHAGDINRAIQTNEAMIKEMDEIPVTERKEEGLWNSWLKKYDNLLWSQVSLLNNKGDEKSLKKAESLMKNLLLDEEYMEKSTWNWQKNWGTSGQSSRKSNLILM